MKRRKNAILLLMVVLICLLLTACGSQPEPIGEFVIATEVATQGEKTFTEMETTEVEKCPFETETTQEETKTTETGTTEVETCLPKIESTQVVEETEPTTCVEEAELTCVLQIQSLKEVKMEENKELPYDVKMHSKSTDAIYNPVIIASKSECKGNLSFSFISEREKIYSVSHGLMIQTNENVEASKVKTLGDIQTFSITIPCVKEPSMVLYQINMDDDSVYYIAIQIEPYKQ